MNKITSYIYLDIESRGILQTVEVTNQDNGIQVVNVTLFQNGTAYALTTDVSIAIRGKTPAGEKILDAATAKTDYSAEFTITEAMSATAGRYLCSIQLTGSNSSRKVIPAFYLLIEKDPVSDSDVEASSEFTALSTALEQVSDITDLTNRVGVLETFNATVTTYVANAISEALASYTQSTDLTTAIASEILQRHPVGSYVILNTTADPNTYLGGTWVKESEGYVLGTAGTSKTVNSTAGSDTHTNTIEEMPAHTHTFRAIPHINNLVSIAPSDTYGASAEATITTNSTGSGSSWDIRQRTKYVYFWKRTA